MSNSEILTQRQVSVKRGLDLVQLQLGLHKLQLYYHTVFEMCSGIQGAIKFAMRHEGTRVDVWADLNEYNRSDLGIPSHKGYRRSGHASNVKEWKVGFEQALVTLTFDDLTVKMHYSDAAKLYSWMRRAGRQAKNWSGDKSRHWNTYARLVDAEENDKVVYAA